MPSVLIIAYGNPLRSDDGLAWRAADELERKFSRADVEILRTHQLTPELAETVSHVQGVIFVDAASAEGTRQEKLHPATGPGQLFSQGTQEIGHPGDVRCQEIALAPRETRFSHALTPDVVVAMAAELYGASPRSFSATLVGQCFDHGETLSAVVVTALPALIERIEVLALQLLSASGAE